MDLVFSRLDDSIARFTISDTNSSFVNALRRTMIGEVPTLAIEDVKIYDNTSVLFDEILAHRLGLIPIKTDLTLFVPKKECSCNGEGCPQCTVTFTLSKEGPGMVTSGDLISMDPRIVPVYDDIPIVKLWEGQKVVLEAIAELNKGTEHAKWQPTIACGYKEYPIITIHDTCDGCGKCVDECPRKVLELSKKPSRVCVSGGNKEKECSLCRNCESVCKQDNTESGSAISISADPSKFIFIVESDGSLPVKEIIEQALLHIKTRSTDMMNALQDISME